MNVPRLCYHLTGLTPADEWTCWQFDNAISLGGLYVESKLTEYVKEGDDWRPKYTLSALLAERTAKVLSLSALEGIPIMDME